MVAECLEQTGVHSAIACREDDGPGVNAMTRSQIMLQILELNPSATPSFLMRFDDVHLSEYLEHLSIGFSPRGRGSTWVRRGLTRAIVSCESLA